MGSRNGQFTPTSTQKRHTRAPDGAPELHIPRSQEKIGIANFHCIVIYVRGSNHCYVIINL